MKRVFGFLMMVVLTVSLHANNLHTVINPTAGILSRGEARFHQLVFKNNGMMVGANVGLFDNFQFGVSYGAENVVGEKEPIWHKQPGFNVRFRIINETLQMPAIAIGVDTQGHGAYHSDLKRYDIKSKGAYAVVSKNFRFLGMIGFDFGTNYTFEKEDDKTALDFFAGMYKSVGQNLLVFADFSMGLNDNCQNSEVTGRSRGYFNTGLQFRVSDQLTLKLLMKDLFKNRESTELFDRSIMIDYRWFF
jgi:hypothetical protein